MSTLIHGADTIRVRWYDNTGRRRSKSFHDEHAARTFQTAIADERPALRPTAYPDLRTRIHASVVVNESGCWLWKHTATHKDGYAQFCIQKDGKQISVLAHRVSYETFVGAIPSGLTIDHLCVVAHCVNPDHLEPVTLAENIRRRDERKVVSA